jgi:hypothetical protein
MTSRVVADQNSKFGKNKQTRELTKSWTSDHLDAEVCLSCQHTINHQPNDIQIQISKEKNNIDKN